MTKITTLFLILLMNVAFGRLALAGELTGRTLNTETNNPVKDVNITLVETGKVVASDKSGHYRFFGLRNGVYHLVATHVGFDMTDTLQINVTDSANLEIRLTPSPWVLNEVVVTGTRSPHLLKDVPVQTEVVTQRDFHRTGAKTVDQALSSSIGININKDLSGQGAQIRGIEGDRILVLIDGERAVGRVHGSIDLGQYSLDNVKKIEIVKGTGSTLYGSDAMGGVINIITKRPKKEERNARVYLDYGSFNTLNPTVEFSSSTENFGWQLGGRYYATSGFDLIDSTPHTNGLEKIDRLNLNSKLVKKLSKKWTAVNSFRFMREKKVWVESEIWPGFTLIYDDEEINSRIDGSLSMEYLSGDKYSMNMRFYGTYNDHDWNKVDRETGTWVDTSQTEDLYYEFAYSSNYVIGSGHVATYGLDYTYQSLSSAELDGGKQFDRAGDGYLQYEYTPIKQLSIVSGIRYEKHSSFGSHVNPSLNIMYMPDQNFKVRGFVGRGFRMPSIKQLYFIFDHSGAGYIVYGGLVELPGNLTGSTFKDMTEETSINSSLSLEMSYGTLGLHRLTYFYNHLDDLIEFVMIGSSQIYYRGIFVYQNIETAVTQGIEWESRMRFSKSTDLSFSYNYLYSRNLETAEALVNRPTHTFKFFLTGNHDASGFGGSFYGVYQSKKLWVPRSNTGGNEGAAGYAPGRTTLNINLFKRFGNDTEAFVRVENILNEVEPFYGYWPERTISLGFKRNFTINQ